MRPSPAETLIELRALVFGPRAWDAATPPRLTWILSRIDAWDAIEVYDAEVPTSSLIDMVRAGDPQAEIALYLREIPMLEGLARAFTTLKPSVFDQDDMHQSGVAELLELAADEARSAGDLPTHFQGAIRARLAEEVEQLDKPIGVPRRTANRVREALKACNGDATEAARRAEASPGFSAATFWAAYSAMYNRPLPIDDTPSLQDYTADDEFESVDNRILVHHLLSRGILSAREIEVLQRSFLYSGAEAPTDADIGSSMGLSRSRITHLRNDALAVLRSELGQMNEVGEIDMEMAA